MSIEEQKVKPFVNRVNQVGAKWHVTSIEENQRSSALIESIFFLPYVELKRVIGKKKKHMNEYYCIQTQSLCISTENSLHEKLSMLLKRK